MELKKREKKKKIWPHLVVPVDHNSLVNENAPPVSPNRAVTGYGRMELKREKSKHVIERPRRR